MVWPDQKKARFGSWDMSLYCPQQQPWAHLLPSDNRESLLSKWFLLLVSHGACWVCSSLSLCEHAHPISSFALPVQNFAGYSDDAVMAMGLWSLSTVIRVLYK